MTVALGALHVDHLGQKTYYIRYRHLGQQYWEGAGSNLTLARKALAIRKAEIAQRRWGVEKVKSHAFEELVDKYKEYVRANNLLGDSYETYIKNISAFFAGKKVHEITPFLIEKYKLERQRAKRVYYKGNRAEVGERTVRPATVNRDLSVLSKMLSIAVQEGWIPANPARHVAKLREDNQLERILMPEEEDRLFNACEQSEAKHLKPIVVIALHMGMRLSEILTLKWEQIDFQKRLITLIRTKNGKVRKVDTNSLVFDTFTALKQLAEDSVYVFPSPEGRKAHISCVKKAFDTARKKAGLKGLRFHDLRHTWATRLLDNGVSPAVVRDLGGWSNLSILNRYVHSTPQARKEGLETLVRKQKCEQSVNGKVVGMTSSRKLLK